MSAQRADIRDFLHSVRPKGREIRTRHERRRVFTQPGRKRSISVDFAARVLSVGYRQLNEFLGQFANVDGNHVPVLVGA
jgi:hypothetical protein